MNKGLIICFAKVKLNSLKCILKSKTYHEILIFFLCKVVEYTNLLFEIF